MIQIKRLELHDTTSCIALGRMMHEESKYAHIEFDDTSVTKLVQETVLGYLAAWIAYKDSEPVGILCIHKFPYFFNRNLYAAQDLAFYIKPTHRSLTLARSFLHEAEQWCAENSIHALALGVTAPVNSEPTIALFNRLGYTTWGSVARKEFV